MKVHLCFCWWALKNFSESMAVEKNAPDKVAKVLARELCNVVGHPFPEIPLSGTTIGNPIDITEEKVNAKEESSPISSDDPSTHYRKLLN